MDKDRIEHDLALLTAKASLDFFISENTDPDIGCTLTEQDMALHLSDAYDLAIKVFNGEID